MIDRRTAYRIIPLALIAIATLTAPTAVRAGVYVYGAVLTEQQEVPPTGSPAMGGGQFLIDTDANTVTYRIAFTGLAGAETAAHIHGPAGPGVNGGVLVALPAGNPKSGVWAYSEPQESDILAGRTYANIHSAVFPGGEIRGQIVPLNAQLDGEQETPPVPTAARGWGVFSVNTTTNELSFYIAYAGLSAGETGAHIHGSALYGTPAGILFALPAGNPKMGVWTYPDAVEPSLLEGQTYVNIHSGNFPGGEIRGQIVPLVAPIDDQQEVPPTGSAGAAGLALIAYSSTTDDLGFDIRFANLSSAETAAHIHGFAPPGQNAGVLFALPLGNRKLGIWNFGSANEANVFAGLTYVNMHSVNFPGGEIRGQIRGFPAVPPASVDGEAVVPRLQLEPNRPNPFTDATTIRFSLDRAMPVQIRIYDPQGRLVRTLANPGAAPGVNVQVWDGRDDDGRPVASGPYGYVLRSEEGEIARKLVVIR